MNWLCFLLIVIVVGKWLCFVLLSPLIRLKVCLLERHDRRKEGKASVAKTNDSITTQNPNVLKRIIKKVMSILSWYMRYMDFAVGNIPSFYIRDFIYRYVFGVKMKEQVTLHFGAEIRSHYKLHIGRGSIIGDKAVLDARRGIFIGENVALNTEVQIWTLQHDYNDPDFACSEHKVGSVTLGDHAWIGARVIILPHVTIGEGAVVASGAVVTKDVPPYTLVGGVPAKVIGSRNKNLRYNFKNTSWFY